MMISNRKMKRCKTAICLTLLIYLKINNAKGISVKLAAVHVKNKDTLLKKSPLSTKTRFKD